jgi:hypothetical protein
LLGTLEDIGSVAGIASFLVMLGLFGLYILRAREIRKVRRSAPFLVNAQNGRSGKAPSRRAASRGRRRRAAVR